MTKKDKLLCFFSGDDKNPRGGIVALAKLLEITPEALYQWGKLDGKIPQKYWYSISKLTDYAWTVEQISKINWVE